MALQQGPEASRCATWMLRRSAHAISNTRRLASLSPHTGRPRLGALLPAIEDREQLRRPVGLVTGCRAQRGNQWRA